MEDTTIMAEVLQQPYKVYKADSGTIIFVIVARSNPNLVYECASISLIDKECPHKTIYEITINYSEEFLSLATDTEETKINMPLCLLQNVSSQKYWLSWYNDTVRIGVVEDSKCLNPCFEHQGTLSMQNPKRLIGYIKFLVDKYIDWIVESVPVFIKPITHKYVDGGKLRWVKMLDDKLPSDALIGGFENEPIYIARAKHAGSMCPGKYVPSKTMAYVPWGHIEHEKKDFEILCGFNALWVKCQKNFVPENVFIAGTSEVRGENLYIGRAMIDDDLVVGKVHMLYHTCYLPYHGDEVEKYQYEILVRGDMIPRGVTCNTTCLLNPMKALQLCI